MQIPKISNLGHISKTNFNMACESKYLCSPNFDNIGKNEIMSQNAGKAFAAITFTGKSLKQHLDNFSGIKTLSKLSEYCSKQLLSVVGVPEPISKTNAAEFLSTAKKIKEIAKGLLSKAEELLNSKNGEKLNLEKISENTYFIKNSVNSPNSNSKYSPLNIEYYFFKDKKNKYRLNFMKIEPNNKHDISKISLHFSEENPGKIEACNIITNVRRGTAFVFLKGMDINNHLEILEAEEGIKPTLSIIKKGNLSSTMPAFSSPFLIQMCS